MTVSRIQAPKGAQPGSGKNGIVGADERRQVADEVFTRSMKAISRLERHVNTLKACDEPGTRPLIEELEAAIAEIRLQIAVVKADLT